MHNPNNISTDHLFSRKGLVFLILGGLFITNALMGEIIGVKLIQVGPFTMTMGVIPWPVVFITTDLINEYYGKEGVKRLTFITVGLILYAFALLFISMEVPAASFSPVPGDVFNKVFGQSLWIIVGSVTAFLVSQFLDVFIFSFFKTKTQGKMLWLRATGSTVASQLIDTFIVLGIAFWLPGTWTADQFVQVSLTNYTYKVMIAIGITPIIYIAHMAIDRFLKLKDSPM